MRVLSTTEGDIHAEIALTPGAARLDPAELAQTDILVKVIGLPPPRWSLGQCITAVRCAVIDGRIRL